MQTIKPDVSYVDDANRSTARNQGNDYFDPMAMDGITPKCCCGYELIKSDDEYYRCTGGNHTYRVSDGDVIMDKFGNIQLRMPTEGMR